jgi:site-specific DNA recombinase
MVNKESRTMTDRKAIIYCRVSNKKQKHDGDGLHSQEHRCRDYADARGYVVESVFHDDVSGGGDFMKRPGMVAMLRFLKKRGHEDRVVIFDDLNRFARDTIFHLKLRQELATYNATVECLNFKFEDTPDGQFVETVIAAQGQLERSQNRRQTLQKMKARVERGYYVFAVPMGYRYEKAGSHGRLLVRNEPLASILQEALEGYASGRFQLQAEVKRFLEAQPAFPKTRDGIVRNQEVARLLTRPVYAGYVEAPAWGVSLCKGHHEPLISFETFKQIQVRIAGNARTPARKNLDADFPLRGAVVCGHCGTPLTACWAKGKYSLYPYYFCPKRGCECYSQTVRRETIKAQFETILRSMQPSENVFAAARAMFKTLWNRRLTSQTETKRTLDAERSTIERQVEQFLDRIADTDVPSIVATYEKRIRDLEERKIVLAERIANCGRALPDFDDTLKTSLDFLRNPGNLWDSARLEDKRAVLKLAFAGRLAYTRNEGFKTPDMSLPFKVLQGFREGKSKMVRPERFQLPALGIEIKCLVVRSVGPQDSACQVTASFSAFLCSAGSIRAWTSFLASSRRSRAS